VYAEAPEMPEGVSVETDGAVRGASEKANTPGLEESTAIREVF